LKAAGIGYVHIGKLGGLRRTTRDSINGGWRNASFRGFADYMQTPEFTNAVDELIELASRKRIAIMCAEAVPWRCHRSLISDALLVRGISAEHIMSLTHRQPHALTPFAKVRGTQITYPPEKSATAEKSPLKTPSTKARAIKTKQKSVSPKKRSNKPRKRKSVVLPVSV
jgi:hypothetical protein